MGVTIESKNHAIDMGYGGFRMLRIKVAELTVPDIFEHYKKFLTRHASKIAGIYSGEVEEFAKYIRAGVFTNIALKKMFAELEVNKKERDDLTVLKGYLLGAIKPQESNFCM